MAFAGHRGVFRLALILAIAGAAALAQAPQTSIRPMPRPGSATPVILGTPEQDLAAPLNPSAPVAPPSSAAPESAVTDEAVDAAVQEALSTASAPAAVAAGLAVSPRPRPRPAGLAGAETVVAAAAPAPMPETAPAPVPEAAPEPAPEPAPKKKKGLGGLFGGGGSTPRDQSPGYVCEDPDILGEELAPITSKTKACNVAEPVRVTSVAGLTLSPPATITCQTATALKKWVNGAVKPTFGRRQVVGMTVAASYTCRPRNNIRGAKISEHGSGRAIDISGFVLKSGMEVTVRQNYSGKIRKVHKAACGTFGTTLGPGSDGYHEDHLHFDTASYRNGPYCR